LKKYSVIVFEKNSSRTEIFDEILKHCNKYECRGK
jgi:hypothetical protein